MCYNFVNIIVISTSTMARCVAERIKRVLRSTVENFEKGTVSACGLLLTISNRHMGPSTFASPLPPIFTLLVVEGIFSFESVFVVVLKSPAPPPPRTSHVLHVVPPPAAAAHTQQQQRRRRRKEAEEREKKNSKAFF